MENVVRGGGAQQFLKTAPLSLYDIFHPYFSTLQKSFSLIVRPKVLAAAPNLSITHFSRWIVRKNTWNKFHFKNISSILVRLNFLLDTFEQKFMKK